MEVSWTAGFQKLTFMQAGNLFWEWGELVQRVQGRSRKELWKEGDGQMLGIYIVSLHSSSYDNRRPVAFH